ncbi:uncharacterized protein MYCFIDRAFT_180730 [Pseudocercospora fijiensis CIRAD86]|uniref:Uncharacterized protein n=1 Tax=Pseudocercospora fijiensis (strain CIRAD86) TaxID=383855 RepID=M3AHS3_PSEFD|nr:uncharacterized protein MYCFIDRAFT_180730 [Pseudocercospora fijiensis CIRAD86]EME76743.1 hypothetical protein MYCFIDRAFT_180730 [Pseudocercospora fijiensis CIRAD86]
MLTTALFIAILTPPLKSSQPALLPRADAGLQLLTCRSRNERTKCFHVFLMQIRRACHPRCLILPFCRQAGPDQQHESSSICTSSFCASLLPGSSPQLLVSAGRRLGSRERMPRTSDAIHAPHSTPLYIESQFAILVDSYDVPNHVPCKTLIWNDDAGAEKDDAPGEENAPSWKEVPGENALSKEEWGFRPTADMWRPQRPEPPSIANEYGSGDQRAPAQNNDLTARPSPGYERLLVLGSPSQEEGLAPLQQWRREEGTETESTIHREADKMIAPAQHKELTARPSLERGLRGGSRAKRTLRMQMRPCTITTADVQRLQGPGAPSSITSNATETKALAQHKGLTARPSPDQELVVSDHNSQPPNESTAAVRATQDTEQVAAIQDIDERQAELGEAVVPHKISSQLVETANGGGVRSDQCVEGMGIAHCIPNLGHTAADAEAAGHTDSTTTCLQAQSLVLIVARCLAAVSLTRAENDSSSHRTTKAPEASDEKWHPASKTQCPRRPTITQPQLSNPRLPALLLRTLHILTRCQSQTWLLDLSPSHRSAQQTSNLTKSTSLELCLFP